jgi:hypothetical protein
VNPPPAGQFYPPQYAYDGGTSTSAYALIDRHCQNLCSGQLTSQTEWSGFPPGYRPQRLVVSWRANSVTVGLSQGDTQTVTATIFYKIGAGSWTPMETFVHSDAFMTQFHDTPVTLPPNTDSGSIQVRAELVVTHQCNANPCAGPSHAVGDASVADIWLEVTPVLTVSPPSPVRGSDVELKVEGVPEGAVSDWQYEPTNMAPISRLPASNATTWSGKLVANGTASAKGVVPATFKPDSTVLASAQSYQLSQPVTVTPRTGWFSPPAKSMQVNPLTPAPPRCSTGIALNVADPEVCGIGGAGPTGVAKSRVCFNWDQTQGPQKLNDNGPNQGVWWLTTFVDLTSYNYALHQKIDPGNPLYCEKQCGNFPVPNSACSTRINDVYTSCEKLREAMKRHEGDMQQNSHWMMYKAAQDDPSRNFGIGAEAVVGAPSLTLTGFQGTVTSALSDRELEIKQLTAPEIPCQVCSANCVEFWGHMNCRLGNLVGP